MQVIPFSRAAVLFFAGAQVVACGGCRDGTQPPQALVASRIEVVPSTLALLVGTSRALTATTFDETGRVVSGQAVSFSSSESAVASVSSSGMVSALAPGSAVIRATSSGASGSATVTVLPQGDSNVAYVVPSTTYQTMTGWEGAAQFGELECSPIAYPLYREELVDRLVNELGVNRVRLQLRSGAENQTDYFAQFLSGQMDRATWRTHWWDILNDNGDPMTVNSSGFKFSALDSKVDHVVQPLREKLAARGERLYVNMTYVDFGASSFEHSQNPQEYGELILAAFLHLHAKYGWVPDAVEMILEPDITQNWRPNTIGAALVAAGDRLKAAGFQPAFIANSATSMSTALTYFDQMIVMPRVREYLTDFSYHRYAGVSDDVLTQIGMRAEQYGVNTGMSEHIGSGVDDLFADLTIGRNSWWQQFALAYCGINDGGGIYYRIDQTNPQSPYIVLTQRARYLRQYFYYVRLGAVRIGVVGGDPAHDVVAFRNTDGRFVVVAKTDKAGSVQIGGLPSGTYGINYTTASAFNASLPDQTISGAQVLTTSIPASGVLTVFRR
ncbi:MAG TPA: Ig-like domain-containing protein [Gemmatimonadaceae bacterium]